LAAGTASSRRLIVPGELASGGFAGPKFRTHYSSGSDLPRMNRAAGRRHRGRAPHPSSSCIFRSICMRGLSVVVALSATVLLTGCFEGPQGPPGAAGPQGAAGPPARKGRAERPDLPAQPAPKTNAVWRDLPDRPAPLDRWDRRATLDRRARPGRRARFVSSKRPAMFSPATRVKCLFRRFARKVPLPCRGPAPNARSRPAWSDCVCDDSRPGRPEQIFALRGRGVSVADLTLLRWRIAAPAGAQLAWRKPLAWEGCAAQVAARAGQH
jgi:hypothetical protein